MGKVAFVFSGQGDQHPGMGKDLAEKYPAAAAVFGMCDQLRPGTSDQCFSGTADELMETKNTQPCLFAMELAAMAVLQEKGLKPDAMAGFSLGKVVAATAAGVPGAEHCEVPQPGQTRRYCGDPLSYQTGKAPLLFCGWNCHRERQALCFC